RLRRAAVTEDLEDNDILKILGQIGAAQAVQALLKNADALAKREFGGGFDGGIVEADEMYFGGVDKRGEDDKAIIFGAIERGGDVVTQVIPSRKARHIMPAILKWVKQGSRVATDELLSYGELAENGYMHGTVNHSAGEYVNGQVHTNNIEAFWSHVRRSMCGTYVSVSKKWLQTYFWEFEFRQNLRREPHLMIDLLLQSFPRPVGK
ncbi:IS1595 family transposase, partial [Mesorhizobium sp. IMUNJ 23033]|uniref:IS1595 family transposase n=1 Tax=Mesorhizobium sp. IMUNJ 23033 TaxID=3378039 RepID=UPI00384EA937